MASLHNLKIDALLADGGLDAPKVKAQDALAKQLGNFIDWLYETRCTSMSLWSYYYPYKLVGLVSDDPRQVKSALCEFEDDVKALWKAED